MMRTARLVLKLQRFEVVVLSIATLALSAVTLLVAARLSTLPIEIAACKYPSNCSALQEEFNQLRLQTLAFALLDLVLPTFAGLIIGVSIVAREIERGTASLPWAMSASRRGWFLWRFAILGGVVAILSLLPAITSELLAGASNPGVDMAHSFREIETRGPIIVARALAAFSLASLAGAVMGRALPGLLLATAMSAAVFFGLQLANESWLHADAAPLPEGVSLDDAIVREVGFLLPDGRIVDWETALGTMDDPNSSPADVFPERYIGVEPRFAPEKRARETASILLATFVAAALATVVVDRRRPY
jgi:ABC-type transport system involved in multi-copper enzyme maturation permease subunit